VGTSKSVGSPKTLSWQTVASAYLSENQSPDRIAQLIWRASSGDASTDIAQFLGHPAPIACLKAALEYSNPAAASAAAAQIIAQQRLAGISADLSRRALVQAFASSDRIKGFVTSLFAEATNYLVARDISPLLGHSPRLAYLSHTRTLKEKIVESVRACVASQRLPETIPNHASWRRLVDGITRRLRNA